MKRNYIQAVLIVSVVFLLGFSFPYSPEFSNPLNAQVVSDACNVSLPANNTVRSGAPFSFGWTMDKTVPLSAQDPTPVVQRIDGFFYQVDANARVEIKPTPGSVCSNDSNLVPYLAKTLVGVSKGNHNLTVWAYNYILDSQDQPTAAKQESVAVSIPFVATDPIQYGPPQSPQNLGIKK